MRAWGAVHVSRVVDLFLTALADVERLVDPLVCLFPRRLEGADGAPVRAVATELGEDGVPR